MEYRHTFQLIFTIVNYAKYSCTPATGHDSQLVFVNMVNETRTWLQAHGYCKDMNGTLATKEDLEDIAIPQCVMNESSFWIGDVIVQTPLISLKACVKSSNQGFANMKTTSVETCASICSETVGFELQKNKCRCLNSSYRRGHVNASLCSYYCKEGDEKQFCGGDNVSNIYTFTQSENIVRVAGSGGECLVTKCPSGNTDPIIKVIAECSHTYNALKCVKDSKDYTMRNTTNWLDANQKCIEEYGTYAIESHGKEDCCLDDNCTDCKTDGNITKSSLCYTTWTSTRKYQGGIAAEDFEIRKFTIKSCWYMNTSTSLSYGISDSCDSEDTRKSVVCKITFPSDGQTQCFSNIIEETSDSVDPMYVVNSTIERTIDGGKTSIVIPIVVAIGILIAIAVSLCSIILWKRGSSGGKKKPENNIVIEYNNETNQRSEGIYVSTEEGEYDHLNVKRKVINPSNEQNIYNHATICRDDETYQKQDNKLEGSRELDILENTYSHATYQQSEVIEGEYDVTSRGASAKHDNVGDNTYSTASNNVCVIDRDDTYSTTQTNIVNITGNTDKISTDNVYSTTDHGL